MHFISLPIVLLWRHVCLLYSLQNAYTLNMMLSQVICVLFGSQYILCSLTMLSSPDLDGCPDEETAGYSWPETDLRMVAMVSCICGNINTAEIRRVANRECGGSFTDGAAWSEADISECQFSVISTQLYNASSVSLSNQIFYAQLSI